MSINQNRRNLAKAIAFAPLLGSGALSAQTAWPTGTVKIVVGFPPGGGTDALARILAPKLTTMWGQQVIVENRAGVAGVLAADVVAKSNDGLTLLMGAHQFARHRSGVESKNALQRGHRFFPVGAGRRDA